MIYNEQKYEKCIDIGKGHRELFRIYNQKLDIYYTLRELRAISDDEAHQMIQNDQQKYKVQHPNLVQLLFNTYEIDQKRQDKWEEKQKLSSKNDHKNKDLGIFQVQKSHEIKIKPNFWKIKRLLPNIECTLDTYLKNFKLKQENYYQKQMKLDNQYTELEEIKENESQLINNNSSFFNVSKELQKQLQLIDDKMRQEFPNLTEKDNFYVNQENKEALMISEYFQFQQELDQQKKKGNDLRDILHFNFIQLFLKQMVNLLAGLEFNNLPIRDIYPQNLFIPTFQPNRHDILLGDSDEYQKFFLKKI